MSDAPYYDPYDYDIDADPYPVWKQLRDDHPLYHNEEHGFWALSRWDDVEAGLKNHKEFISGKGTLLELIKADIEFPPGMLIFDDPPSHDAYRSLLSRVFTPKRMLEIEPQVRRYAADSLDRMIGEKKFDVIAALGAKMPMRVIGMLLGIPEDDQQALRDQIDAGLHLEEGADVGVRPEAFDNTGAAETNYGAYLDERLENPTDDIMSRLLHTEFEDHEGVTRTLTREEVLNYIGLLSGAGNETTTKLIGWTMKTLPEYPEQRAELVADPGLINNTIEEMLRYEAPSPVQARYVTTDTEYHGQTIPAGSPILLLNASANHDDRKWGPDAEELDIHRSIDHHLSFGYGLHFCLGAALARLEGRVALEEMLKRFPEWHIDFDESERSHTSTVRGWDKLTVVID